MECYGCECGGLRSCEVEAENEGDEVGWKRGSVEGLYAEVSVVVAAYK